MSKYLKFIVAIIAAGLTIWQQQNGTNATIQTLLPIVGAIGVYLVPNKA